MNPRLLKLVTSALPLLPVAIAPTRCDGTAKIKVTDPSSGVQGELEVGWKKQLKTGKITSTIPPGAPKQTIQVNGISIEVPANPGTQPVQFTAEVTDPVIVQVPLSWSFASASVTTLAGTGPLTVVVPPLPAAGTISAGGIVSIAKYYAAEPGTKLLMGDFPAGLAVPGPAEGSAKFRFPPGPQPIHLLKYVSAGKLTIHSAAGPVTWYPPLDPFETDFALVSDNAHYIVADTMSGTECKNGIGLTPSLDLPANDWKIGGFTSLDASNLMPSAPMVFVLGIDDLVAPIPFGAGGCKLRVDLTGAVVIPAVASGLGTVSVPVSVPLNPWLVDRALAAQAVEFDAPMTLAFSNHTKPRIEN